MKSNTALLTDTDRRVVEQTVLNYEAGVFGHVSGDLSQHTQARMYATPYTVTAASVLAPTLTVTVYYAWVDTGTDLTFSGPYPGGVFTVADISFGTQFAWVWHPYGLSGFGADINGYINVAATGPYTFGTDSDDGSYLFIDGALVVNNGGEHAHITKTGTVTLTAGIHSIRVKFFEDGESYSGLNVYLPAGVTYANTNSSTRTLGTHTLRLQVDYNNNGVSATQVIAVPAAITTGAGTPNAAPVVAAQPQSQQVALGGRATFTVVAVSDTPQTYQWYFSGAPIANAIFSAYTVDSATYQNAGDYFVVVTNSNGSTASSAASLIITG
jgi:PA14 domain